MEDDDEAGLSDLRLPFPKVLDVNILSTFRLGLIVFCTFSLSDTFILTNLSLYFVVQGISQCDLPLSDVICHEVMSPGPKLLSFLLFDV